jgi:hypothetical protein
MKKKTIYLFLLVLSFSIVNLSCSRKNDVSCICDSNNKENSFDVTNLIGTVNYNDKVKMWYISVNKSGTYDQTQIFLTNDIPVEYKKNSVKVVFSGQAFPSSVQLPSAGGSENFCVKITNISVQ